MWGAAVTNPPHYHYSPGPNGPSGPGGPVLVGPAAARHLRPQSSYSLPHGTNGPARWSWAGNQVSSFDRRQSKVPPQPARPAPGRPSNRTAANSRKYDVKDEPRSGRLVIDKVNAIFEKVEQWRHISSYDLAEELGIDHKTVLTDFKKSWIYKKARYLGITRTLKQI
ncbi:hypothetical protein EVAR_16728_1 [Eumeta japonica]|uniref:Uncharacterized protein n=1 Tax=Eumeta variegata TaxID=151549 RepID=A0A4C1V5A6_EUMVA|nr:hypothetical protein EVAR_16728_1 [Eumeta japonica]